MILRVRGSSWELNIDPKKVKEENKHVLEEDMSQRKCQESYGRHWEVQSVVVYVFGMLWEAQYVVFYVSGRLWEAQCVVFYMS